MIENLIQRYKEIKHSTGHSDEFYKYEAIQHFQNNWKIDSDNFADMLKSSLSKYYNLVFPSAFTAISYMAGKESSKVKNLFNLLYDESINLEERIATFDKQTHSLIKSIDSTLNGFQDERTVSVYLTFKYPEKYTFFKDSYYTKFCQLLGEKKARKGKKYVHYLKLIQNFKAEFVMGDEELWQLTNATLPENAWPDKDRNILAQDILYVTFDQSPESNYWVFQCNPDQYDIFTEWQGKTKETWRISTHKKEIKSGDKVILWVTGKQSGCYGLCTVTSELLKDGDADYVEMSIDKNAINTPVLKASVVDLPEFENFRAGNQGTNLRATKEQFEAIGKLMDLSSEEKQLLKRFKEINDEQSVRFHFEMIDLFIDSYQINEDDKRLVFSTPTNKDGLTITVNQRYVFKTTQNSFRINLPISLQYKSVNESSYIEHELFKELKGIETPAFYVYFKKNQALIKGFQKDWLEICKENLDYGNQSGYLKYDNPAYRRAVFDIHYREKMFEIAFSNSKFTAEEPSTQLKALTMNPIKLPKNLILYGPPGTGKTYHLTHSFVHLFTDKSVGKSKELYSYELVKELKWWEVSAICMYDMGIARVNDLAEHPLMIEKINQSNNSKPRNTIWYWLQKYTKQDCPNVNVAKRNEIQGISNNHFFFVFI